MLLITATKHSASSIKFEFVGPEPHTRAAIKALQANTKSSLTERMPLALIVEVSPALLDAIRLCCSIDSVNSQPSPQFSSPPSNPLYCTYNQFSVRRNKTMSGDQLEEGNIRKTRGYESVIVRSEPVPVEPPKLPVSRIDQPHVEMIDADSIRITPVKVTAEYVWITNIGHQSFSL